MDKKFNAKAKVMQTKGIECNKLATTTSKDSWQWVVESKEIETKAAIAFNWLNHPSI
uniref:Uncharacterized protein n=1 Tax=Cucumis melo TaxID=3656 RepID=A0A9I9CWS0_CUCME